MTPSPSRTIRSSPVFPNTEESLMTYVNARTKQKSPSRQAERAPGFPPMLPWRSTGTACGRLREDDDVDDEPQHRGEDEARPQCALYGIQWILHGRSPEGSTPPNGGADWRYAVSPRESTACGKRRP